MVKRSGALTILLLVLAYGAAYAADASARTETHLVPLSEKCNYVLPASDFQDDLEEVAPPMVLHLGHDSALSSGECKYGALTESGGAPMSFTNGGLGGECLANVLRLGLESPPGGCYRLATVSLGVETGPQVTKILPALRKGRKDKVYPSRFPRHIAHGIGNRAEFGYDGEEGYGWVQVLNAYVTIETHGNVSLIQLMREAASRM